MLRSSGIDTTAAGPVPVRSWRATTAVRVFALALVTGTLLGKGLLEEAAPLLGALVIIAGACSALESASLDRRVPLIPVCETALVALILTSAPPHGSLVAYVAVPTVVAGIQHGFVTTLNAALIGAVTSIAVLSASSDPDPVARLATVTPWLLAGLGVGLLASWQSRSIRSLAAKQAPHVAAHQLMARVHQLASSGSLGLNSAALAEDLDASMREATGCARTTVFVVEADDTLRALNGAEDVGRMTEEIAIGDRERTPGAAVVPLRGSAKTLGYCVLVGVPRWTPELDERAQLVADDFAVRLDTAVLFDDVRTLATAEERNRIAREMHDGVAQEIVGLGYIVDEIESISDHNQTRELASTLRTEITRLVSEIRFSIFDLRHEITDGRLAASLADYAREVSHATGLRVHLSLAESGPALPPRTATEVLRVAQEAIGNVRKHARANNLWVTLDSDGSTLSLSIEDDGVGNAGPREHHWGLQTMRERAEAVGARLDVSPRSDGGTVVVLRSLMTADPHREKAHEHHRATG